MDPARCRSRVTKLQLCLLWRVANPCSLFLLLIRRAGRDWICKGAGFFSFFFGHGFLFFFFFFELDRYPDSEHEYRISVLWFFQKGREVEVRRLLGDVLLVERYEYIYMQRWWGGSGQGKA